MTYKVYDNKSGVHFLSAENDDHALTLLSKCWRDYIVSVLSSDSILLVRPNGYILAYISTVDGAQTVKSMSDWGWS